MANQVVPVEAIPKDCHEISTIIHRSYSESNNTFYKTIYAGTPQAQLIEATTLRWPKNLYASKTYHLKLVDPATSQIISYSRWVLPDHVLKQVDQRPKPSEEQMEQFSRDFEAGCENGEPFGLNKKMADHAEEELEEARKSFPKEDHIVLDMIMTLPEYSGKGAASAHMSWGLALADKEKMPVVLEATPVAKAIYLKKGFQLVKEVEHDLSIVGGSGLYVHSLMIRPAR